MASSNKSKEINIDVSSGSIAYNRLDFQVSQSLTMAIDFFDSLEYLLVLDYYDDISIFDDENNPEMVSYYQVKTTEETINISTILSEDWLEKMYAHLEHPEWLINEIGLITNCPVKMQITYNDEQGKPKKKTVKYKAEKTDFNKFDSTIIQKIKTDIAQKKKIDIEDVDLTKFVHMRTTLSISSHRELAEQQLGSFLYNKFPKISMEAAKTVFSTMISLLTKKQSYELLPDDADFENVKKHKGVSKKDFQRIIEESIMISMPPYDEVERILQRYKDFEQNKYKLSYAYTNILSDNQRPTESYIKISQQLRSLYYTYKLDRNEDVIDYIDRIHDSLLDVMPQISIIYDKEYLLVLSVCIMLNVARTI